jgi:hypothetical protein
MRLYSKNYTCYRTLGGGRAQRHKREPNCDIRNLCVDIELILKIKFLTTALD